MLTAESGRGIVMNIVKMGAKDYVVKPFKGEQLIERVKLILDLKPRMDKSDAQGRGKKDGFFTIEQDLVILHLPSKIKRSVISEVETALTEKISQMNAAGARKFLLDISAVDNLNMAAIQLIISVINSCARAKLLLCLVAQADQVESMQGFKETSVIPIKTTIEEARADF
jgi:DNA-binding response OmpR family regulator